MVYNFSTDKLAKSTVIPFIFGINSVIILPKKKRKERFKMTIGEKLAEKRKAKNLTQDEVAEKLGVTPQAVSKWENNISCPDITLLPQIAKLYGTTIDEILSPDEKFEPPVLFLGEGARKPKEEMILRINVLSSDGDKVKVNIPLALILAFVNAGTMKDLNMEMGGFNMSQIDFDLIMKLIDQGVMGKLVEVESADGDYVTVEVV